jgi:hypothetical protein
MASRILHLNWLRYIPLHRSMRYSRLPVYDRKDDKDYHGYHFANINFKTIRWRSPSPGADRFPAITLRMSLPRLIFIIVTTLLCFGLMLVGTIRHRSRSRPIEEGVSYPWQKFPMFVNIIAEMLLNTCR